MRILHNAKLYTFDAHNTVANAIVIDDHAPHAGRILFVGDSETAIAEFGHRGDRQDMDGAVILPGLTDAHIHLRAYAEYLQKVSLFNLSKAECLTQIAKRAQETPAGEWVMGHGWNQNNWDGQFPTSAELDDVSPNHPVYLTATSLHAAWANTSALKLARIRKETPNPENSIFQKDDAGNLTGILLEGGAMTAVSRHIPRPTRAQDSQAIRNAQSNLWQMGITGVHDFDRLRSFRALQDLNLQGELILRVLKHLPVESLQHAIGIGLQSGYGNDMLRIGSIKVFADGALGPRTAAMLQPYEVEPENKGLLFIDSEELLEHAQNAAQNGLSMTVHAIGDAATHEVLKAYRQVRKFEKDNNLPQFRHRLEHAQILHPDHFAEIQALDIITSVQPIHATSDMDMADQYWGARSENSYAWKK
ncbi:MAG: amidohydrolase [Chloroflexota bacterium]